MRPPLMENRPAGPRAGRSFRPPATLALLIVGTLLAGCAEDAQVTYPASYQGEAVAVEGARVGSLDEPAVASLVALLEMDGNPGRVDLDAFCGESGCPEPRPSTAHGTILVQDNGSIAAVVLAMEHTDPEEAVRAIAARETAEGVQAVLRDDNVVVSVQVNDDVPELLDQILDAIEARTGAQRMEQ